MFLSQNCFHFTPVVMKIHTQTAYESRMCISILGKKTSLVEFELPQFQFLLQKGNCVVTKNTHKIFHDTYLCPFTGWNQYSETDVEDWGGARRRHGEHSTTKPRVRTSGVTSGTV